MIFQVFYFSKTLNNWIKADKQLYKTERLCQSQKRKKQKTCVAHSVFHQFPITWVSGENWRQIENVLTPAPPITKWVIPVFYWFSTGFPPVSTASRYTVLGTER